MAFDMQTYTLDLRPVRPCLSDLTPQQREVLVLVAAGLTNREIAGRMFLAERTVKNYMTAILEKLQLRNRTEAAIFMVGVSADLPISA